MIKDFAESQKLMAERSIRKVIISGWIRITKNKHHPCIESRHGGTAPGAGRFKWRKKE
jgi:hypothetical protein